tara:strand:+ start:150 stop:311 length:162 start_codon:yes stop_codon:yes gene_type:complete
MRSNTKHNYELSSIRKLNAQALKSISAGLQQPSFQLASNDVSVGGIFDNLNYS